MSKAKSIIQLLLIVVVGLFILKYLFNYLATKFPNAITTGANHVVQSA